MTVVNRRVMMVSFTAFSYGHSGFFPSFLLDEAVPVMDSVYKAEDLKLKQIVALKFLPDAIARDGGARARFHNEVRITRQISHPNVCRVYDIGEVNGRHFLSMEFIDGEDLSSLLRRIGRLPEEPDRGDQSRYEDR